MDVGAIGAHRLRTQRAKGSETMVATEKKKVHGAMLPSSCWCGTGGWLMLAALTSEYADNAPS
jgi:hypothetical protein